MADNIGPSIDVTIGEGANLTNSEVGVIHYHGHNFFSSYQEAKESIFEDLEELETRDSNYSNLFQILSDVDLYLSNQHQKFEIIMRQVCCGKVSIPKPNQIRKFLILCIKVIIANNDSRDINFGQININGKDHWLFTPHGHDNITIETAIAKILQFFNRHKNCNIKNGICFVSNLDNDGRMNCNDCMDGALNVEEDIKILSDYMSTNQPIIFKDTGIQKDYFDIHTSRGLTFKCGNCVTNVERISESQRVLKGENA